ncbi:hypothetical protein L484_016287 [Morus notabilis]|uniref:Uncharacterized protein n=1 Tax=Morus notabilis TaxID=981085 RepID=W9S622_9ROSA|nr:hypothetical protein L484_016287 [Morus notabilis]
MEKTNMVKLVLFHCKVTSQIQEMNLNGFEYSRLQNFITNDEKDRRSSIFGTGKHRTDMEIA